MTKQTKKIIQTAAILLSSAASVTLCNSALARGAFPEVSNPGECRFANGTVDTTTSSSMVARKSQGIWFFYLNVLGTNAAGDWNITSTKNGNITVIDSTNFSSGWSVATYQSKKNEKGTISVHATASRTGPNGVEEVCTAQLGLIL